MESENKLEDKREYLETTTETIAPLYSETLEKENDWNSKRRLYYVSGILFFIFVFIIYSLWGYIAPNPTCFDNKQNGKEGGVDCGGGCELVCRSTYVPLEIKIAKAFKSGIDKVSGKQEHDLLVLIDNKNVNTSPKKLVVDIDVYGSDGSKLDTFRKEVKTTSFKTIPIVINNYIVPNALSSSPTASSTLISSTTEAVHISKIFARLEDYKMYKTYGAYDIRLSDYKFEDSNTPKLELKYMSPYKENINENFDLLVLLKDSLGNLVGFNTREINKLITGKEEVINFTWEEKINSNVESVELVPQSYLFYTNN